MTVLFWDIDGTVLTTAKGGVPAWEAAVLEVGTSSSSRLSSTTAAAGAASWTGSRRATGA